MKHKTCISVADRSGNKTEVLRSRRVGLPVMKLNEISLLMPIKAKPYEHQIKAFGFVCGLFGIFNALFYSRRAALLMEMGCGKTITAIAITAKKGQLEEISNKGLQIVVVNYESAWRLEKELKNSDADLIIVDEGHKIKSAQTATGKCRHVLGDRARYKLFLTPMGRLMGKYAVPYIISLLMGALYNIIDQIFITNAAYLGSYGNAANMVVLPLTVVALVFGSRLFFARHFLSVHQEQDYAWRCLQEWMNMNAREFWRHLFSIRRK